MSAICVAKNEVNYLKTKQTSTGNVEVFSIKSNMGKTINFLSIQIYNGMHKVIRQLIILKSIKQH